MSNYTPTGNPIAETRGTSSLIRNEFVLIQQAVNSKSDANNGVHTGSTSFQSATFSGTVTVPTPVNPTDAVTKAYADTAAVNVGVNRTIYTSTATASQTIFGATYIPSYLDVFINGVMLMPSDYSATTGTGIVLNTGCAAGDEVMIIVYNVLSLTMLNIAGGTAYSIPYQTGPNATSFVTAGTSGFVLTSNGPSAAPTYTAAPNPFNNSTELAQAQAIALCF